MRLTRQIVWEGARKPNQNHYMTVTLTVSASTRHGPTKKRNPYEHLANPLAPLSSLPLDGNQNYKYVLLITFDYV